MRIFLHFLFLLFISHFAVGQNVALTFRVDMSNEDISADGVHVAGNFQAAAGFPGNWNPGTSSLSDPDQDEVFELTVSVPPGTYLYKFVNGDNWTDQPENPPAACSVNDGGGNFNRQVTVGPGGLVLPVVQFDSCNAVLVFSVNMLAEDVDPEGVFVTGDFLVNAGYDQNWLEPGLSMSDLNGDGTYTTQVEVSPGSYSYIFSNGNIQENISDLTCASSEGYRTVDAFSGQNPVPVNCFDECVVCDPNLSEDYTLHWWNDAVFYEIFVRSFYDSNGDGIGDFQGIIEKLDYLNDGDPETDDDLGITGIWLMPTMPSPSYHGYDVTDYYGIEADYGTMDDFLEFLDEAHARGIRVILDYVMNHSSNQHPWFTQSANNLNGFRDWYVWSDIDPGFAGPWGQDVWHNFGGDYYYGLFWGGMPDLNYDHPPVKEEMMNIAQYWIDLGVDGYRLDAIKYLDENGTVLENTPETFQILEDLREEINIVDPEAVLVGEVWSNTESVAPYVQNDRIDICFEFSLAGAILTAVTDSNPEVLYSQLSSVQNAYPKLQFATFLTNHDIDRVFSQLDGNETQMKLASSAYLTLPGVPFIYYGEEIGMTGMGPDEIKRRPMQWNNLANGGFTTGNPWIGLGNNFSTNNVESMSENPASLLSHYKRLIKLRNELEPLRRGYSLILVGQEPDLMQYIRIYNGEAVAIVSNLSGEALSPNLSLPISTLPSASYVVTEMMNEVILDPLDISTMGSFSGWNPENSIPPGDTRIYHIGAISPLTVDETEAESLNFTVYPNPASETLSIAIENQSENFQFEIFDVNGKLVNQGLLTNKAPLSIDNLEEGIYFIRINQEGVRRFAVIR